MIFSEENGIIPLCSAGTTFVTTGMAFDSFNMKGYDHATLLFQFGGAMAATAGYIALDVGSADGGDSGKIMFHYRVNSASAGKTASNDVYGTIASASSLSFGAYSGNVLVMEVDAEDLPDASKTYEWVTATIASGNAVASAGTVEGWAILSRPRYADSVMNTALA